MHHPYINPEVLERTIEVQATKITEQRKALAHLERLLSRDASKTTFVEALKFLFKVITTK